jgi:hypothetical protein
LRPNPTCSTIHPGSWINPRRSRAHLLRIISDSVDFYLLVFSRNSKLLFEMIISFGSKRASLDIRNQILETSKILLSSRKIKYTCNKLIYSLIL